MEKLALTEKMFSEYNSRAYTHKYILTFTYKGNVWYVDTDSEHVFAVISLDKASRGAGYSIRFKPNTDKKLYLLSLGAKILCSELFFNELVENSIYNRGEIAEKLITEQVFGQVWEKDNVPFTDAGDVEANGEAWQIKHEKATFCNEKQLAKLMGRA